MATHADFALVASAREAFLNRAIQANFSGGPFFFPLPQTIIVGGETVTFGGMVQIAAPAVELHPNAQNTARFHFAFFTTFNARVDSQVVPVDGGSASQRTFRSRVRLDASVDLAVYLGPVNGQIILQLNTAAISFQPLKLTILEGPRPPQKILDALQSQKLADAATNAVRQIRPVTLTTIASNELNVSQPGRFKDSNFSVFEWFRFTLLVSRVVIKVFEGAITVAVDFAKITNGNENALTDLTGKQNGGSIRIQRITDNIDSSDPIFLGGQTYGGGADIAFAFNHIVMSHVLDVISPQIAGTPVIHKEIAGVGITASISSISGGYSFFEHDLHGWESGIGINVGINVRGIDGSFSVKLQPFFREYDRATNVGTEGWYIFVAQVDIDFPWYIDVLVFIANVLEMILQMIVTVPLTLYNKSFTVRLLDRINKGFAGIDTDNLENNVKLTVQNSVFDAGLPRARYIALTHDGIDMGFGSGSFAPFALPGNPPQGAYITPVTWDAENRAPIITSVSVIPEWARLISGDLLAVWEIRRKDTNQIIATGTRRYVSSTGNGISIPHHSKDLYLVKEFIVRCRLTTTLQNQVGEIWSGVQNIVIQDKIDRSHPYVEWGPEWAYFANAGTDFKTWMRYSRSRIHRTAVAARCRMLKAGADDRVLSMEREAKTGRYTGKHPKFRYKDTLPFSHENINQHRKELCEYCFFGGPDKTAPYPVEDWFEPNEPSFKEKNFPKIHP